MRLFGGYNKKNTAPKKQEDYKRKWGELGEKQVGYQLKYLTVPNDVIYDLNLDIDGIKAQIDYVVITQYYIYVIEVKNYGGDLKVVNQNQFIRVKPDGTNEGIESPLGQNDRHMAVLKKLVEKHDKDIPSNFSSKYFKYRYKSLFVPANSKNIIDLSEASDDVKTRVVKYDGLLDRIHSDIDNKNKKEYPVTEDDMHSFASFLKRYGRRSDMGNKGNGGGNITKPLAENMVCPECKKGKLIKRPDRFNKGQFFLGCSNYPACKYMAKL